jgi:protein-S-isoprenylcysteine O-methyltransferase Ste14
MTSELFFRVAFSILWIIFFTNAAWVRYSSREYSVNKPVERASRREGRLRIADVALLSFAPFWFGGIVLYAILPGWVTFLSIPLPDWFRLIMVVVGLLSITFAFWGYRTLGTNWVHALEPSKFHQKAEDALVTTGPYRYVRNPIYLGAFSLIVAQGLVAANWLVLLPALPIIMVIYTQISGEEAMLIERFGDEYREYMERTPRLVPRLLQKHIRGRDGWEINVDVFLNPSKYLKRLPLGEIVADTRVYRKGVERYKEKIVKGESVPPIIVVKHPTKDLYAVLDGHHRYYAYVELGRKEIDCALAGNTSGVIFYLTKYGIFQPPSELTEHIRVPAFEFNAKVKQFLFDFLNDPNKIQKSMDDYFRTTYP